MRTLLPALALLTLALTGCPDKGKELMKEASEARDDAITDIGGAPKRTVDHTVNRVGGSMQKGMDRLESMPTE